MMMLMNKNFPFQTEQQKVFESDPSLRLGDVTTVNLTAMAGGVQVGPFSLV